MSFLNTTAIIRQFFIALAVAALLFACNQNGTEKKQTGQDENTTLQSDPAAVVKPDSLQQKPDPVAMPDTFIVDPLEVDGDLGQITFTQNDKTLFYFRPKSKKGAIRIDGIEYPLIKYSYDARTYSYTLSGGPVTISAMNGKFGEMESDCAYGKFALVTITMGKTILKLNKVEVQDCPNP